MLSTQLRFGEKFGRVLESMNCLEEDLFSLLALEPDDGSVVIKSFSPAATDFGNWELSFRNAFVGDGKALLRIILNSPYSPDQRVLVDICETGSRSGAKEFLAKALRSNELPAARLFLVAREAGISVLSEATDTPIDSYQLRNLGNMSVVARSFATSEVDVSLIFRSIWNRMARDFPESDKVTNIEILPAVTYFRRKVRLTFSTSQEVGEGGMIKFIATGGDLRLRGEEGLVYTHRGGRARLRAFSIGADGDPSPVDLSFT